jgi:hypothetical protein
VPEISMPGFDAAGAENVIMGAGLRASARVLELPPDPTVGAPVPDPTCEEPGLNRRLAERLWHRWETRRPTEITNFCLNGGKVPARANAWRRSAISGMRSLAPSRITRGSRSASQGKPSTRKRCGSIRGGAPR